MPSLRYLCVAFFSLVFFYFLLSQHWRTNESIKSSAAIGVSLSANHGTVSIRQPDGSFRDAGKVDGDATYLALMKRLSLSTSQHPSPPYDDMDDQWNDQPRQFWRNARKAVGLPASSDVAILSSMAKKLVQLAGSPSSVLISYPSLPGLYQDDIADVATYLGIPMFEGNHGYSPHEITATYAGHGMGLCKSFKDEKQCDKEGLELPVRHALLVEYTEAALLLHTKSMREAYDLANHDMDVAISFDLGSGSLQPPGDLAKIRDLVVQLLHRRYDHFPTRPAIITIIMTGSPDSINVPGVQDAIKGGVKNVGFEADLLASNPGYVAARGAAELAWRALSLQEHVEIR